MKITAVSTGTLQLKPTFLVDAGGRPGMGGGVTRTRFDIAPDQALVPALAQRGFAPGDFDRVLLTHLHGEGL